ncbi:hypothetical protein IFJ82_02070 [Novacetimonas hansenii]|uniref:hypothetical protein n=1 Tax=Novacetimonas hansenii TaxID=436 RepID=UPI00177FCB67|nr:hypothetical protein [Novacetimonas hansenii]QOF95503.1 hypothetical protein IFJ82_02070 [Novacetimonas hansenii]
MAHTVASMTTPRKGEGCIPPSSARRWCPGITAAACGVAVMPVLSWPPDVKAPSEGEWVATVRECPRPFTIPAHMVIHASCLETV